MPDSRHSEWLQPKLEEPAGCTLPSRNAKGIPTGGSPHFPALPTSCSAATTCICCLCLRPAYPSTLCPPAHRSQPLHTGPTISSRKGQHAPFPGALLSGPFLRAASLTLPHAPCRQALGTVAKGSAADPPQLEMLLVTVPRDPALPPQPWVLPFPHSGFHQAPPHLILLPSLLPPETSSVTGFYLPPGGTRPVPINLQLSGGWAEGCAGSFPTRVAVLKLLTPWSQLSPGDAPCCPQLSTGGHPAVPLCGTAPYRAGLSSSQRGGLFTCHWAGQ